MVARLFSLAYCLECLLDIEVEVSTWSLDMQVWSSGSKSGLQEKILEIIGFS